MEFSTIRVYDVRFRLLRFQQFQSLFLENVRRFVLFVVIFKSIWYRKYISIYLCSPARFTVRALFSLVYAGPLYAGRADS